MNEIDEALAYAAKWNQKPPSSKGMNYHMQVLAAEVERRRELDGLVDELISFARVLSRRPGASRPLLKGKLNLYDCVNGRPTTE